MVRENWNRGTELLEFTRVELDNLIQAAFPDERVLDSSYAEGGLANTNICIQLSHAEKPVLLRMFVRDPEQAKKEYKLSELIGERVPCPRALYFSSSNPVTGHPYLIREWTDGRRLETVVPGVASHELIELAHSLGATLAAIHSHTFERAGFFDGDLNVAVPLDLGSRGLIEFAHECLIARAGGQRLGSELTAELMQFIASEAGLLDEWTGPPCLTHSDFGGSNILVRHESSAWKVVGVLDWEFAFSGTPLFDFGNLLRRPLGIIEGFEESVAQGYIAAGGQLPASWRQMSLLTDLTAWLEFLVRPNINSGVIATAQSVISTTIANWHS